MTAGPKIDVTDLNSVRSAAEPAMILGDEYGETDLPPPRPRSLLSLNRSPIARKIIIHNLLVLILMAMGLLYVSTSRVHLVDQRASALLTEASVIAGALGAHMPENTSIDLLAEDGDEIRHTLAAITPSAGSTLFVLDRFENQIGVIQGPPLRNFNRADGVLTRLLRSFWEGLSSLDATEPDAAQASPFERIQPVLLTATNQPRVYMGTNAQSSIYFVAGAPILHDGRVEGMVALASAPGEVNALLRQEREKLMQLFVVGVMVSIGLSMVLASTITNPLADLAAAAELGSERSAGAASNRVRIPDLTGRPDEIGRLAGALRGMVTALYERIESNEQFAADVAHEIKNPLASLRSAVGTMRVARQPEQQEKLLNVIEHDVQRLDRLVSDISNASRLDSELVKEQEKAFDLIKTVRNITEYLGAQADERGIEFITDMPERRVILRGLEGRLAQVFVNLITNAISFCEDGDAIRVWVRRHENRVIVVVEDTGPGIPESALKKVFKRFYSERPSGQFGNNSGLGLAISKQIVEAHGGVIWAENIRPTSADLTSEPLGARFVVGLPI